MTEDAGGRLRRVADRLDLQELAGRYNRCVDRSDWTGLAELLAPEIRMSGWSGRDEVVDMLRRIRRRHGRSRHVALAHLLTFADDDSAGGVVASSGELDIGGVTYVCAMDYLDGYVRRDGRWLLAVRDVEFHYVLPWHDLGAAMTDERPVRFPGTPPAPAGRPPSPPARVRAPGDDAATGTA